MPGVEQKPTLRAAREVSSHMKEDQHNEKLMNKPGRTDVGRMTL